MVEQQRILVGITGASGANYAVSFMEAAREVGLTVDVIVSDEGRKVMEHETEGGYDRVVKIASAVFSNDDFGAPVSSGSNPPDAMVVVPCSVNTLAKAANGISDNLLTRVIHVCLKEKRQVVLSPRETPLDSFTLENMLKLSKAGVCILPLMPGFYHRPSTIRDLEDFISARILDVLGFRHHLFKPWQGF